MAYVERRVVSWDDQLVHLVYVAELPDGPVTVLEGPAAHAWSAAIALPEAEIVDRIASQYETAPEDLQMRVGALITDLLDRGLLEPAGH